MLLLRLLKLRLPISVQRWHARSHRPRRSSPGGVKNSLNCGRCIINKPKNCCCLHLPEEVAFLGWWIAIETCDGNFYSRLAFISICCLRLSSPAFFLARPQFFCLNCLSPISFPRNLPAARSCRFSPLFPLFLLHWPLDWAEL